MKELSSDFSVLFMCRYFGVSPSGYYSWCSRPESKRSKENKDLLKEIRSIHFESKKRYGAPRVHISLKKKGLVCSKAKVAKLMRKEGLRGFQAKSFKPTTTDSNHKKKISPRIFDNDEVVATKPNEIWVSDITYIPTKEGWVYLFMVLDVFTRKIIGHTLSENMSAENLRSSFIKALKNSRARIENLIFHSDQGAQYCETEFRKLLELTCTIQSMSRKGNCYDNAFAETFFHSMKAELNTKVFKTKENAKKEIEEYIEWYNAERFHSSLDYMSPVEYEKSVTMVA